MSKTDILLSPEALAACEPRSSPVRDTSEIHGKSEPSTDEGANHQDKHIVVATTTCNGGIVNVLKKKQRRRKKRRWRPYNKLNWEEKKELEEREAKRAEKLRADMCACGLTMAPYNTTQFLMEDHNAGQEPDYERIPVGHNRHRENSNSQDSSDDYYSSPEDEEDFLQQQFTETYKTCHAERLSSLSKSELVQELMTMEDRVEALQKRLEAAQREKNSSDECQKNCVPNLEQMEKIRVFQSEIESLTDENERLRRENVDLRNQLCVVNKSC